MSDTVRLSFSLDKNIKELLKQELKTDRIKLSDFFREIIEQDVEKGLYISIPSTRPLADLKEIVILIDNDLKNKFQDLFIDGSHPSSYLRYKILEYLTDKGHHDLKGRLKESADVVIDGNTIKYNNVKEMDKIDIYLEQKLKAAYKKMLKEQHMDITTHLNTHVINMIESGKELRAFQIGGEKKDTYISFKLTSEDKEAFLNLFGKTDSVSAYFRTFIIEELIRMGHFGL